MKALLLAAGEGTRMLPLTADKPKCLLTVGSQTLIEHHILNLKQHGFTELVINVARWAEKIQNALGDGARYGVRLNYSIEPLQPLETGGGVLQALPLLGQAEFAVVNTDVWTDYPFSQLPQQLDNDWMHLVMVPTPAYRTQGDFDLKNNRISENEKRLVVSGISVLHANLFQHCHEQRFSLLPLFRHAIAEQRARGELYHGTWLDVGTPERYQQVCEFNHD